MTMNRENIHQSLAAANILCNIFMVATHLGWTSPAINKFQSGEDGVTASNEQLSWIASISEITRFFGPLLAAIFLDKIGRKLIMQICSMLMFLSWLSMAFSHSMILIYIVKMFFGATQGVLDVTGTLYLAENCTPKMRGVIGGLISLCSCSGFILEYVLVAYNSFTFAATVNAIIGFGSLLTCIFLKESPYYLVMKGRTEEAKQILLWLRGKNAIDGDIKFEMDQIEQNMQQEVLKKRSWSLLFSSPENYKSLLLVCTFSFLAALLGACMILPYTAMIFQPSANVTVKTFTIIYGVFQFISACVSPFIVERYNRRTLLLNSLGVMSFCHVLSFFLFRIRMDSEHQYLAWLIFTAITTFSFIINLSYPLIVIIRGELLPMSVRAIGGSLNIMTSSIGALICIKLFIPIKEAIGIEYNFLLACICCILQFILVLTVLPETRGKTLVDIQMSFHVSK